MIDDGSTDDSAEICRGYAERDSRFRLITRSNGGLSAARNTGLNAAQGEWICFVDSDDIPCRTMVERLINAAIENDTAISMCAAQPFGTTEPRPPRMSMRQYLNIGRPAAAKMLYQTGGGEGIHSSAWGKLFRADLWRNRRFTPGILYEDIDVIPEITAAQHKVVSTPDALYMYRMRDDSILGRFDGRRLQVLDVCSSLCERMAIDPILHRAACDRLLSAAFNMLLLLGANPGVSPECSTHHEAMVRCQDIIRRLRFDSLHDANVRLKNKAGILMSYFPGLGFMSRRRVSRRLLSR